MGSHSRLAWLTSLECSQHHHPPPSHSPADKKKQLNIAGDSVMTNT